MTIDATDFVSQNVAGETVSGFEYFSADSTLELDFLGSEFFVSSKFGVVRLNFNDWLWIRLSLWHDIWVFGHVIG